MTQRERLQAIEMLYENLNNDVEYNYSLNEFIDDFMQIEQNFINEHLSALIAIEAPFLLFQLKTICNYYEKVIKSSTDLSFLYELIKKNTEISGVEMVLPNISFNQGDNNDKL